MHLLRGMLQSKNAYSPNSMDSLPRQLASMWAFGNVTHLPVPDIDRTDFLLIVGANPVVTQGSVLTAPGMGSRIRAIQARGGKVVVIDPRRSETAAVADVHHFVQPGTDALLLMAMLHVVFARHLADPHPRAEGVDRLRDAVRAFSPERVAGTVGIDAAAIVELAVGFARAERAVAYGRLGTCVRRFGALTTCLLDALNTVSGNLDRPGGAMFATPAFDLAGLARLAGQSGSFDRFRSRSGLPETNGELPVAAMADEIEEPGPRQMRALVCHAGNPASSLPNRDRTERALGSLELLVSIDLYVNETSRFADYILPTTVGLERGSYPVVFGALAARDFAKRTRPLLTPPPGVRDSWAVLLELSRRILSRRGLAGRAGAALLGTAESFPDRMLSAGLRLGPHRITGRALDESPHGIDLGPLRPRLDAILGNRGVTLLPEPVAADVACLAG